MTNEKKWYEDDNLWKDAAPALFSRSRWVFARLETHKLISLLNLSPGSKVLDVCCGVGRFSLEFARAGFQVTGVDRTPFYIKKAQKMAKQDNLKIDFVKADMLIYSNPEAFDLVLNLSTSFGYFENPDQDKQVLENANTSLRAGGRFVLELLSKEVITRNYQERNWYKDDGIYLLEERRLSKNMKWMESWWTIIIKERIKTINFAYRLYSAEELEELLKDCGFKNIVLYGDFSGRPFDYRSEKLIIVAEKDN